MQLLAQCPSDARIVVTRSSGAACNHCQNCSVLMIRVGEFWAQVSSDRVILPIPSVFLLPSNPIGGASLLPYDPEKHKVSCFHDAMQTGGLELGMKQNPEVNRMVQRSLFRRLVQKPLDLPIEKQQELQTAIAELLLTALTQNPMPEEANIDDDEQ